MPSVYDVYPDKWLRPDVIGNRTVTVTIEKVTVEKLYNSTARKHEDKLVIRFVDKELRLICNKTQTLALVKICGTDDYTKWHGHRIRLGTATASNGKPTFVVNPAQGSAPVSAPTPTSIAPQDDLWEVQKPATDLDEDFYPDDHPAKQPVAPENLDARPQTGTTAIYGARPVNQGDVACTACHAPPGKPHATSCTAIQGTTPENQLARPPENVVARSQAAPLTFEQRVFAQISAIYGSAIPVNANTSDFMRKCRNADHDSAMKMSLKYYESINVMLQEVLGCNDEEADMVMAALVGYRCTATVLPGQLVHSYLMKPMRNNDANALSALSEIYELCVSIWMEEQGEISVPE